MSTGEIWMRNTDGATGTEPLARTDTPPPRSVARAAAPDGAISPGLCVAAVVLSCAAVWAGLLFAIS